MEEEQEGSQKIASLSRDDGGSDHDVGRRDREIVSFMVCLEQN